jgi:thiol-disulfide isomerase/thioredoxin
MTGRIAFLVVIFLAANAGVSLADEPAASKFVATADETELIDLINSLFCKYDKLYAELEKFSDLKQRFQFFDEHDPAKEVAPQLLAFEQRHPRTEVGLMALRRINLMIDNRSAGDDPLQETRRQALQRLLDYADSPVLPEILRYFASGLYDSTADQVLRALAADPKADPTNREFARVMMAECMLAAKDYYELIETRTHEIALGGAELWAGEKDDHMKMRTRFPNLAQVQAWEAEAAEILRSIANSGEQFRQPAVSGVDPKWYLIRFDAEQTKTMPLLSGMAEGLLFKELHLKLGKPAPDLNIALVSGDQWSLADQRGKVVVIQFSFKGCGPCEAMYPELRELEATHKNRLAVLSIMADQNKTDTDESVAEGKLTWNVCFDGWRGPVATRWAVRSFPTVYVVDREGQIAATTRRDLKKKVTELLHE